MSNTENAPWELIDCFAGGGLASFGFRAAGMRIVSAVDNSAEALSVYKLNFQHSISCATLGPGMSEYKLPDPGPRLHVHLSPPCQELSNANVVGYALRKITCSALHVEKYGHAK